MEANVTGIFDNTEFEQFKESILSIEKEKPIDKIGNFVGRAMKHYVGKYDPTGVIDLFLKEADRLESIQKEEIYAKALYLLYKGIQELYKKHQDLKELIISSETPFLLNKYSEKVNTINNINKINYLKNLVCNGFINSVLTIDDKELFINLLNELTYDQINILVILYKKKNFNQGNESTEDSHVTVGYVSKKINKSIELTSLQITNLIGKGLIIKVTRYLDMDDLKTDSKIDIEKFVMDFVKEIIEIN
jgi:hypothetical protein